MLNVIVPMSVLSSTAVFIECACGNDMHVSMSMCGDCINEESNVIGMGQRVLIHTRRSFKYGN